MASTRDPGRRQSAGFLDQDVDALIRVELASRQKFGIAAPKPHETSLPLPHYQLVVEEEGCMESALRTVYREM